MGIDSERPIWERHIQTALLAMIGIGVVLVGNLLQSVSEDIDALNANQNQQYVKLAELTTNQGMLTARVNRMEGETTNRYTSTDAAADMLRISEQLAGIRSDQRDASQRLRDLENEVARAHGSDQ